MINSENEYKVSKAKYHEVIAEVEKVTKAFDQDPLRNKLILASLQSVKQELENEIAIYEDSQKT